MRHAPRKAERSLKFLANSVFEEVTVYKTKKRKSNAFRLPQDTPREPCAHFPPNRSVRDSIGKEAEAYHQCIVYFFHDRFGE